MRSVRRRLSMPSTASLMWSGRLLSPGRRARLEIDVPAELGGDHDLVAERRHAFAEDAFDLVRTVSLGRVEEGDAAVERGPDDVEHLGPAAGSSSDRCGSCSGRRARRWRPPASPAVVARSPALSHCPRACCLGCSLRLRAAEKRHRREPSRRPQEPTTPRFKPVLFSHVWSSSTGDGPALTGPSVSARPPEAGRPAR